MRDFAKLLPGNCATTIGIVIALGAAGCGSAGSSDTQGSSSEAESTGPSSDQASTEAAATYTLTVISPKSGASVDGEVSVTLSAPGFLNVEIHSAAGVLLARVTPTSSGAAVASVDVSTLTNGTEALQIDAWDSAPGEPFKHHASLSLSLDVQNGGTGTCGSAPPITIPATTCSILSYGAKGDGTTNNAAAIQAAFDAAASSHCTVLVPSGTFAYSGTLTADAIAITGTGADSVLKALDTEEEALVLTGTGGSIKNLELHGTGTKRLTTYQSAMIWVNSAKNFTIQNVLIDGGSCVGIYVSGGENGVVENNTVENTLADSITDTDGSSGNTVKQNRIINSGDDGISNNSYNTDATTVNHITVENNTILDNAGGRGVEVSGGSSITFAGNYVDNTDGYTDIYISSEEEWNTQDVSAITVTGNAFLDGGPNQGSVIIYNSEPGSRTISNVTVSANQFDGSKMVPVQYAGSGPETDIFVENNTAYFSGPFSYSGNPAAVVTEKNNVVDPPASYKTPLVSPGGGCNFAGCSGTSARTGAVTTGDCSMPAAK